MRTLFRRAAGMAAALALVAASAAAQQSQAPAPVAGKWSLTSDAAAGVSTLDLKVDGQKVSGTLVGPSGNFDVAGTYEAGVLTFSMDYQGQVTVTFTGKVGADGSLTGTMEYGQGPVAWTAVRVKDTNNA